MRRSVQSTSRLAYNELRDSGVLGDQQQQVYGVFRPGQDLSLQEVSRASGVTINAVCGRVNELKKMGLLEKATKRPCLITGRLIQPIQMPEGDPPQAVLFPAPTSLRCAGSESC